MVEVKAKGRDTAGARSQLTCFDLGEWSDGNVESQRRIETEPDLVPLMDYQPTSPSACSCLYLAGALC